MRICHSIKRDRVSGEGSGQVSYFPNNRYRCRATMSYSPSRTTAGMKAPIRKKFQSPPRYAANSSTAEDLTNTFSFAVPTHFTRISESTVRSDRCRSRISRAMPLFNDAKRRAWFRSCFKINRTAPLHKPHTPSYRRREKESFIVVRTWNMLRRQKEIRDLFCFNDRGSLIAIGQYDDHQFLVREKNNMVSETPRTASVVRMTDAPV